MYLSAIRCGDLNKLNVLYDDVTVISNLTTKLCCEAVLIANLKITIWLLEHGCKVDQSVIEHAFRGGNVDIILLLKNNFPHLFTKDSRLYVSAILSNNFMLLDLLKKWEYICTDNAALTAARLGHLKVLIWIKTNKYPIPTECLDEAIRKGHTDIIKWLINQNYKYTDQSVYISIETGNINIFNEIKAYYILNNLSLPLDIANLAALHGNIKVLEWANENDYKINKNILSSVIANGYIRVAEWLLRHNFKLKDEHCCIAASKGRIDFLEWLISKKAPYDSDTCLAAVINGHLKILEYLRMIKCNWDKDTCLLAAQNNNNTEIINWIKNYKDIEN